MTSALDRRKMLDRIRITIQEYGRHVYSVSGGHSPRFLYTIGLYGKAGVELLFAGGAIYDERALASLLNRAAVLIEDGDDPSQLHMQDDQLGPVRLVRADQSWVSRLLLGALDYYDIAELPVWQLVPEDTESASFDIPNTTEPFSEPAHPAWRWLDEDCPYNLPPDSIAITDLDLMLGYGASEVMRWDSAEWEIYSGEKPTHEADTYRVPLAPLLAFDAALAPAAELAVGRGLIRDYTADGSPGPWQPWGPK
ncbi:MAG: hypothetical protein CSA72_08550 [Rhodobacterales bacterium]|nr:MAG: hypothetical protein CSA72_08550 [Rhodobacterales bacterium]